MATGLPSCPDPEHAGARVVRNGRYGPLGQQRYRCIPVAGRRHTFSVLSDVSPADDEEERHPLQDDARSSRLPSYRYDVAEIAAALVSIGGGASYRQAAIRASAGTSSNGQLVANWIRDFGPAVTAPDLARSWPRLVAMGILSLQRQPGTGTGPVIQVAVGADDAATPPRLWDARVAGGDDQREWREFLSRRPGAPTVVIAAGAHALAAAAAAVWPGTPVVTDTRRRARPAPADEPADVADVEAHGGPVSVPAQLRAWTRACLSESQAADFIRGFLHRRAALARRLGRRQAHFRNAVQLDQLLDLMRIDANGEAAVSVYRARIIAARPRPA
jgi:hypothetical protein